MTEFSDEPTLSIIEHARAAEALGRVRRVRPRSSQEFHAYIAEEDGAIETKSGATLSYAAGRHYIVIGESHSLHPVRRDIFEATHRAVGPGIYRKRTDVILRAVTAPQDCLVRTLEGSARAQRGDWIMIGVAHEIWPVPADEARRKYAPAMSASGMAAVGSLAMTAVAGLAAWAAITILGAPTTQIAALQF